MRVQTVPLYFTTKVCPFRFYYFSFFCFHLVSMSSTICNMLVYGWLNENIASQSVLARNIRDFAV